MYTYDTYNAHIMSWLCIHLH